MKNWKKKLLALYMLALLAVPVVSNVVPKEPVDLGVSACNAGPGSPWTDGTTFDDSIETNP